MVGGVLGSVFGVCARSCIWGYPSWQYASRGYSGMNLSHFVVAGGCVGTVSGAVFRAVICCVMLCDGML